MKIPADDAHFRDRFDWSLQMRIPGGGFVWSDDDYNFEAPEIGYQESVILDYKATMPIDRWRRGGQGSFFVKFADGCHGRIRLKIDGMERGDGSPLTLTTWLNPKPGSRNLSTPQMTPSTAGEERNKNEWKRSFDDN